MDVEIIGGNPAPTLEDLNNKAIQKLYDLMDGLESKSSPDLIRACVESLAKLNASIKGSDIFAPKESAEERRTREEAEAIKAAINGS